MQQILDNLAATDLDLLTTLIATPRSVRVPSTLWDPVQLDRALGDVFENEHRLDARRLAERIGAISCRLLMVDLRDVAIEMSHMLMWGVDQRILSLRAKDQEWTLERPGVTFVPTKRGWRDAREEFPVGATSKAGLISREDKYRLRRRNDEKNLTLRLIEIATEGLPDNLMLAEGAAELVYPYTTVAELRINFDRLRLDLTLWQAVRLQWHCLNLYATERQSPMELSDFRLP